MEMNGDFTKTFIIALVCSAIAVVAFTGLLYYIALNWAKLIRIATPNRWRSPPSEKTTWPQPRTSDVESKGDFSHFSPVSSPTSSVRSSRGSNEPMLKKSEAQHHDMLIEPVSPVTPPQSVQL
ncbi:hypothetical protein F4821DRAFT_242877 [Hypoxylon rubiginosum]|uniref:Uncharacterized protein n=1 Tax=Hypoxylon rubiginosum TaxID=110542 RepID=A0ACC0CVI0_9PEZI|nr:hypothetical protein F4821DRAFT_242877 [Hypoxylon rubiginosum]